MISPSLDDFNKPCIAVIVKKKNWDAKFLYAIHLSSYLALMIQHLKKIIFIRKLKKKGF